MLELIEVENEYECLSVEASTGRAKEGLELRHMPMTSIVAGYQNSRISLCSFSQHRQSEKKNNE